MALGYGSYGSDEANAFFAEVVILADLLLLVGHLSKDSYQVVFS